MNCYKCNTGGFSPDELVRHEVEAHGYPEPIAHDPVTIIRKSDIERRIAEAVAQERDRIGMVLCSAVKVEDGNTEINECYFRVTFMGAVVWSAGGKCSEVEPEAHEFAASYRDRIAAAIRARGRTNGPTTS